MVISTLGQPVEVLVGPRPYDEVLYQMSDPDLLARATEWAATEPAAHNEAFNLTNGDVILGALGQHHCLFSIPLCALAARFGSRLVGETQPLQESARANPSTLVAPGAG